MIAIKGRTQSWGCFSESPCVTLAINWKCKYTSWWMRGVLGLHCVKRLSATLQRAGGGGWGGWRRMRLVFLQRGNQTNWLWSIAEPLGRACCLLRQCDTADPRHRHNKMLIRQQQGHGKKRIHSLSLYLQLKKKRGSSYIRIGISLQIY